jgi:hypothetical protein
MTYVNKFAWMIDVTTFARLSATAMLKLRRVCVAIRRLSEETFHVFVPGGVSVGMHYVMVGSRSTYDLQTHDFASYSLCTSWLNLARKVTIHAQRTLELLDVHDLCIFRPMKVHVANCVSR